VYKLEFTNKMARDLKRVKRRGKNIDKLDFVLEMLVNNRPFPEKYKDHQLRGKYLGFRECHIEPDWLLMYRIIEERLVLSATGTGTHTDLFAK
jgi:mRNA interferase YafQ